MLPPPLEFLEFLDLAPAQKPLVPYTIAIRATKPFFQQIKDAASEHSLTKRN